MYLSPLTELEAVNMLLSMIGEAPVNTLELSGVLDVAIAKEMLNSTNRSVQTSGWWFNAESQVQFSPNDIGEIVLPQTVLSVDSSMIHQNVAQRGLRLYDLDNHTYTFTDPVQLDVVYFLAFEELPEQARAFITTKAARAFQVRMLGDKVSHALTDADEFEALARLQEEELKNGDYNLLTAHSGRFRRYG